MQELAQRDSITAVLEAIRHGYRRAPGGLDWALTRTFREVWKDKPIVVFTTTLMLPKDAKDEQKRNQDKWDWGAGRKLRDLAKSRRLNAVEKHLWVEVKGTKGPLVETGVQSAKQFTRDILLSLQD